MSPDWEGYSPPASSKAPIPPNWNWATNLISPPGSATFTKWFVPKRSPWGKESLDSPPKTGSPFESPTPVRTNAFNSNTNRSCGSSPCWPCRSKSAKQTVAVLSVVNPKNEEARFTPPDEATLSAMAEQAAHTLGGAIMHNSLKEIDRLERDMELAKEVQQLLLPKTCPQLEGYDIAAASVPAQEVGGDYYDFFLLDNDRLGVAIADVSGKGIPGALTMATVRSALRALAKQDKTAREMITELNRFIRPDMRQGTFISMSLVMLRLSTGEIQLARAGHEPLLLLKNDRSHFDQITPPGIVLGLVNGDVFAKNTEIQSIQLDEGDTVVLYTDGVTEAMNRSLEEFTLERFLYSLKENRNRSAQDTIEAIRGKITEFSGNTPQHDDLTLVVIKRQSKNTNPTQH